MSEPLNFLKKKTPESPDQEQIFQGKCAKLVIKPEDLPRGHPEHPDNIDTEFYLFHLELDDDCEIETKAALKAKLRDCKFCDAPEPSPYLLHKSIIIHDSHYLVPKSRKEIERIKELERYEKYQKEREAEKRIEKDLERVEKLENDPEREKDLLHEFRK